MNNLLILIISADISSRTDMRKNKATFLKIENLELF